MRRMDHFRNRERAPGSTRCGSHHALVVDAEQMKPSPSTGTTPDYLHAAVTARARLGIASFAAELELTPERAEELIWSHEIATGDDSLYADCLDRGDVILARLSELPVSQVENWIRDEFDFGWNVACPPALQRVLDSLQETIP